MDLQEEEASADAAATTVVAVEDMVAEAMADAVATNRHREAVTRTQPAVMAASNRTALVKAAEGTAAAVEHLSVTKKTQFLSVVLVR